MPSAPGPADPSAPAVDPDGTRSASREAHPGERGAGTPVGGRYAHYTLAVLVLVYVFNFLDRQILSILNERIKADLGLSDAQMGFLYGTAFAVFYAIFGIPLGRLADVWVRRSLIATGLAFWSAMTAFSGLARSFGEIAAARIGVGVGEASASPAAFSLLSDSYPPARRATVLALYSSGIYLGAGLGMMVGGQIVERWDAAFAAGGAPLGLAGWQAAFFAVGLPGLVLAVWVRSLREPRRGQADGVFAPEEPHPFRAFLLELRAVLPGLTLLHLARAGAGSAGIALNLGAAAALAAAAALLVRATGDGAQWIALAVGLYAAVSWVQALRLRDRATAALVFGTPSLRHVALGLSFLAFTGYGIGYWLAPYFVRVHGAPESEVGTVLGISGALGGWLGVTLGGVVADQLRERWTVGRLVVALATAALPVPFVVVLLSTDDVRLGYALTVPVNLLSSMWIGVGASTVQDLVLPRMRASASAFYLLVITFVGLALGPYTIGRLSDATGSLRTGLLLGLLANVVAATFVLLGMRHLPRDERTLRARAAAAGETGLAPPGPRVADGSAR